MLSSPVLCAAVWLATFQAPDDPDSWPQPDRSIEAYERIQDLRGEISPLLSGGEREELDQAAQQLEQALEFLKRPRVRDLANGEIALQWRWFDVCRDLAVVSMHRGDDDRALKCLEEAAAFGPSDWFIGWLDDTPWGELAETPRYKRLRQRLDAEQRVFHSDALKTPYQEELSAEEMLAGLSLLWSEAKYNFAFFDQVPDLDWDALYLETIPEVLECSSTLEYYTVLMRTVAELHDAHTNVYPPSELGQELFARPPLETAWVEDRVLITDVRSPTLRAKGLTEGLEVTHVDDVPIEEYAEEEVAPYQCHSTPQDRVVRLYSYGLLFGYKDARLTLTVVDEDGATRDVELHRGRYSDVTPRSSFRFAMLDDDVAYLALDGFDTAEGLAMFERHREGIFASKALILDVRRNGGGSTGNGLAILSWLSHDTIPYGPQRWRVYSALRRARGSASLEWSARRPTGVWHEEHEEVYGGEVIVLTSARTFSAAEDFVVSFQAMNRGVTIGETTGGSTGQPMFFDLPGGGTARICTKRDLRPDGTEWVGYGLAPDIEIRPTVAGVRSGRDDVLEAALEHLKEEKRP